MRFGLSFLLMVVLVLRGLAGTAMAAGIVPPLLQVGEPQTHHSVPSAPTALEAAGPQSHGQHHEPAAPTLAPMPAELLTCDESTAGCTAHEHHAAACSACEICHSAMLDAPAALTQAHLPPGPLRPLSTADFDSAAAALAIKPPIA